jgi:selenocysteine-specific elongation factor
MHVVATAGHVDHGKSTLVRALTGMEPDRWAEERRRGMTIDLGYAWVTLADGEQLAFVDVPGHERFVPNMLAGLGPVPAVMFVVAADGGWMPQSAEHLAAADALRVRHGLLVVTRADLADPGPALRRAAAELAATSLGDIEAVAVSAVTGAGLDDLRAALARLAASMPGPDPAAPVRLWIDRSFTIRGSGTVVTGTLAAGTIRTGQELLLTPSLLPVRVRAVQALGQPAGRVTGVARVALNLRGVPAGVPARGMALVTAGRWTLTSILDVRLTLPGSAALPKFPAEVLLHVGSARTQAQVRLLGRHRGDDPSKPPRYEQVEPGTMAVFARLTLRDKLPLHVGDRVLLRDPGAAGLAIFGATVLDPAPPPLGRRAAAAAAAAELTGWPEVPAAADLLHRHGLLRAGTLAAMGAAGPPEPVAGDWLADPAHWARLRAGLPTAVAAFTKRDPLAPGMPVDAARAALNLPARDLVIALLNPPEAAPAAGAPAARGPGASPADSAGTIILDGAYLRVAAPQATTSQAAPATGRAGASRAAGAAGSLPPRIASAIQAVLDDLAADPFAAPDGARLRDLGLDGKALAAAARGGLLLRVADLVVFAPGADREAARVLAGLPQPFTTSQARQALNTSRRVVIPLLEYLDRARVTERLPGDLRRLRLPRSLPRPGPASLPGPDADVQLAGARRVRA